MLFAFIILCIRQQQHQTASASASVISLTPLVQSKTIEQQHSHTTTHSHRLSGSSHTTTQPYTWPAVLTPIQAEAWAWALDTQGDGATQGDIQGGSYREGLYIPGVIQGGAVYPRGYRQGNKSGGGGSSSAWASSLGGLHLLWSLLGPYSRGGL